MTLAEFLLARIAEDEEFFQSPHWRRQEISKQLLVDCEAKRRIVKDATAVPTISMRHVLRLLAMPYADHPDYNQEWRP